MTLWIALIASGWMQAAPPSGVIPPAPPPPPVADDPIVRKAVSDALFCFDQTWNASSDLWSRAETQVNALRASGDWAAWGRARETVQAYVSSRKAIAACARQVDAAYEFARSRNDRGALDAAAALMRFNFDGQTASENRILRALVAATPPADSR